MIGPGKYDDLCTKVREEAGGGDTGVILLILRGNKGNGFSCQATLHDTLRLPNLLREVADQIEKDGGL